MATIDWEKCIKSSGMSQQDVELAYQDYDYSDMSRPDISLDPSDPFVGVPVVDQLGELGTIENAPNATFLPGIKFNPLKDSTITFDTVDKHNGKAKKIKSFRSAVRELVKNYAHCTPWMFALYLYKDRDKHFLFHCIEGLPISTLTHLKDEKTIVYKASWHGTNGDMFIKKNNTEDKKDHKEDMANVVLGKGDDEHSVKAWKAIAEHKITKKAESLKNKLKNYNTTSRIMLRDVKQIDMYTWGFCVLTNTPIDFIAIKKKAFRSNKKDGFFYDGDTMSLDIFSSIGQEFEMPQLQDNVNYLTAYWDDDSNRMFTDDEVDHKIFEQKCERTSDILDVGQATAKNIDL